MIIKNHATKSIAMILSFTDPFHKKNGFTLIELVVVVLIVGILAGGVVPLFRGSLTSIEHRRVVSELASLFRFAQEVAIHRAAECRVYLDIDRGIAQVYERDFSVHTAQSAEPKWGVSSAYIKLPSSQKFKKPEAKWDEATQRFFVRFYPSGASDFASVEVFDDAGHLTKIRLRGTLGKVEVSTS